MHPWDVKSGRPQDVRWGHPQDGQKWCLRDVLGASDGDDIRANMHRLEVRKVARFLSLTFLQRSLNRFFLHMITYLIFSNFSSHIFSSTIFLLPLWISCLLWLTISFLLHFKRKMKLKKGNTQLEFKYLLFYWSKRMILLTSRTYGFQKKFDRW